MRPPPKDTPLTVALGVHPSPRRYQHHPPLHEGQQSGDGLHGRFRGHGDGRVWQGDSVKGGLRRVGGRDGAHGRVGDSDVAVLDLPFEHLPAQVLHRHQEGMHGCKRTEEKR